MDIASSSAFVGVFQDAIKLEPKIHYESTAIACRQFTGRGYLLMINEGICVDEISPAAVRQQKHQQQQKHLRLGI